MDLWLAGNSKFPVVQASINSFVHRNRTLRDGRVTYHMHLIILIIRSLRWWDNNIQALPDVLLEFTDIHPLSSPCVIHCLWPHTPGLSLSLRQKIAIAGINVQGGITYARSTFAITIIDVVEARPILVLIVEELSIERDGPVCICRPISGSWVK